nr:immunoglobulin heavy chain junction region [Mus musculus]
CARSRRIYYYGSSYDYFDYW